MRIMILVKASPATEAGQLPSEQMLTAMTGFNEQLVKAGVLLAGEGLHPSRRAKRVRLDGAQKTVVDGPFSEGKELVAGFWLWQVSSMDEAVAWTQRIPCPAGEVMELELRPVFEAEDFGASMTPELRERQHQMRSQLGEGHEQGD